jgi:hypothetical protein
MVVMPFGHIKNHSYPFQLKAVLGKSPHPPSLKATAGLAWLYDRRHAFPHIFLWWL